MKRMLVGAILSCLVLLSAGTASAAPPPGWDNVFATTNNAFLSGTLSVNGVPVPLNLSNILAAFAPGVVNPIGTATGAGDNWSGPGAYAFMSVYADAGPPKNGASVGDNVTFQFYSADLDRVLTAYDMTNVSDGTASFLFPAGTFPLKTINFDFKYDAPPVWTNVPVNGSTANVSEGAVISDTLAATDPNADPITFGIANRPAFCSVNPASGAIACAPGFADAGTYDNVCFTATSTGFSGVPQSAPPSCITLVVLDNNRAPALAASGGAIDNLTLYAGVTTTRTFTASDLDNQALTFIPDPNMPGFCQLLGSGNVRTLSCTPTLADQGQGGSFNVTVTDGIDNTSLVVTGAVVNRPPVIADPGTQTVSYAKASPTTIPLTASDPDGNAVSLAVKLISGAVQVTKSWFAFDNATNVITITGPVPILDNGAYTVSIRGVDNAVAPAAPGIANLSFALNIALQVAWDNPPAATLTVAEAGTLSFSTKATDPLGNPVAYTASGIPGFCSLDNATRVVTCNPGYTDSGSYPMSFTAAANGYFALPNPLATTLTVTNTNRVPTLNVTGGPIDNLALYAGVTVTRTFTAADADNQALSFIPDPNMPAFCQLLGSGNVRTLSCTPTVADQGLGGSFNVTVTDGTDNASLVFSGNVVNRKPAIAAIANQTVSYLKATPTTIPVTITDADGNAIASSNATITPAAAWFSYDSGTRTITIATPLALSDVGSYAVAVSATDNGTPALAADNVAFTLNVVQQISWDNTVPAAVSVNEGATAAFPVKASDPLGGAVSYILSGLPAFCADNAVTGTVTCSPGYRDAGTYTITSRATASGYFAQPDNVVTTLTVVNHSVPAFSAVVPADNTVTGVVGTGAAAFGKAFTVTDADPTETLHWTTQNLPAFCTLTGADNTTSRSVSCTPSRVNQQGAYDNVSVTVSDGFDNVTSTFSVVVDNRAPVVSLPAVTYVGIDNAAATTIPVTVTDPDGNAVAVDAQIAPPLAGFSFDPATNLITIAAGLTPADVRSNYAITLTALDNGTPAVAASTGAGSTLAATLKVVYPRRFTPPVAGPGMPTMSLSGTVGLQGAPAAFSDEVAAYSIHKVPGSNPVRWEKTLVGAGRIDDDLGGLPAMAVLGDNPATASAREGCVAGEEVLLVLSHNTPAGYVEYFAFDNGAGGPLSVAFGAGTASAAPNFVAGNRYPLRTDAWNLVSYGVNTSWYFGAKPPFPPALAGPVANWVPAGGPDLNSAFPLASIAGKYAQVMGNSGTGGTRVLVPGVGGTLTSLQPGLGYMVKTLPSAQELAWMTVPGDPLDNTAVLSLPQGYAMIGFWDEGRRYHRDGYNDNADLASLRTMVESTPAGVGAGTGSTASGASIGPVWSAAAGKFDRLILYDAGGARIYVGALPPQFNTMKYIAPGYGTWIKVTDPAGATVGLGLP